MLEAPFYHFPSLNMKIDILVNMGHMSKAYKFGGKWKLHRLDIDHFFNGGTLIPILEVNY
jgi:hypothetical protein